MVHSRTALVSAVALVLGAGLFGVTALPASGDPTAATDHRSAADWNTIRVASVAAAQRRMDAEAGEGDETLVVFAVPTDDVDVDVPPAGDTPGDFFLFEEQLYTDPALTQPIGRDSARGEFGLSTLTFEATFKLDDGKIRIAGSLFGPADLIFPITGGTGEYRDAGGVFIPFTLPNGTTLLLFRLVA